VPFTINSLSNSGVGASIYIVTFTQTSDGIGYPRIMMKYWNAGDASYVRLCWNPTSELSDQEQSSSIAVASATPYYVTFIRSGCVVTCHFFTDSARTTLYGSMILNTSVACDFPFICFAKGGFIVSTKTTSGSMSDFEIITPVFYASGLSNEYSALVEDWGELRDAGDPRDPYSSEIRQMDHHALERGHHPVQRLFPERGPGKRPGQHISVVSTARPRWTKS